jgi:hypothetical protein
MKVRTSLAGRSAMVALLLATVSGCAGQSKAVLLPSSPPATSTSGSSVPSTTVPTTQPATTTPAPDQPGPSATTAPVLALSDHGYGPLVLGMSKAKAFKTGLIGKVEYDSGGEGCSQYHGRGGLEWVYIQKGWVSIIVPKKAVKLDTGIGVGSTYLQLHKKYPNAETPSEDLGRFYIPAPDAAVPAVYRIGLDTGAAFADSKVSEIALQAEKQACYE